MGAFLQDCRYALRSLQRSRGLSWIVIITLAFGIAANALVFSITSAVILKHLPYPQPGQLMIVHWQDEKGRSLIDVSAEAFFTIRDHPSSFASVSALYPLDLGVNVTGVPDPQYVKALRVSGEFFRTLQVAPELGREFRAEEDQPGGPRVAIVSQRLWKRSFGGDSATLGQELRVDGEPYIMIGVMPRNFRSYPEADLWLPLQLSRGNRNPGSDYRVIGRLKQNTGFFEARTQLQSLSKQFPLPYLSGASRIGTLSLEPLHDFLTRSVRQNLTFLFGAVVFALLIACTNLALLLLVRSLGRIHEVALRTALGSTRMRLIRILLLESFLLTLSGAVLGVIGAKELLPLVLSLLPAELPISGDVRIDSGVLAFAFAASALSFLIFTLAPAFTLSRKGLGEMLRMAPQGVGSTIIHTRTGHVLIALQTALTLVLLTGATFFLRNFLHLQAVEPGFDSRQVWIAQISLAGTRYSTTASSTRLLNEICSNLRKVSGVQSVAVVDGLPLEKGLNLPVYPEHLPGSIEHAVEYRIVSPDYFRSLRIQVLAGRSFSDGDQVGSQPVALINETLARRWWPGASPVGHFLRIGEELGPQFTDRPREIIGVVANIHESHLGRASAPTVFVPQPQVPDHINAFVNRLFLNSIVVRTNPRFDQLEKLRSGIISADTDLSIARMTPFADVVRLSLAQPRFYAFLTSAFSSFALLLSAIGLYGLLSYRMKMRTREIAMRIVFGATRSQIFSLVVFEGLRLVAIGIVIGTGGGFFLARFLRSLLYNMIDSPYSTLLYASVVLFLVATLSSLLRAARAAVEPMILLRSE
jgi:putative ABC transport system permease protein